METPEQEEEEEIFLYSTEEANNRPDEAALENITLKLVQIDKLNKQTNRICVYDDRFIGLEHYDFHSPKKYWTNLLYLDEKPKRSRSINWTWAYISLALFNLGTALIYFDVAAILLGGVYYALTASVVMILLAILALIALFRSAKHTVRFYSSHGRIPLVELLNNKPSKTEFRQFLEQVSTRISQLKAKTYYDRSQRLAAELAEHRRLLDEGILSSAVYEQAKQKIFSQHKQSTLTS